MKSALDPEVPADDPEMFYFRERGVRNLLMSMVMQSLKDCVSLAQGRQTTYDIREQQFSADWMKTDAGKRCLSFIMPDVSPDAAVARIYADPEAVLNALERSESGGFGDDDLPLKDYRLNGGAEVPSAVDGGADDVCAPV